MMAASADQNENGAFDNSDELGRLAAEMMLKSPLFAMNPSLVAPTAALAAAAIVGFGLSTRMTGAFFTALQGAMDVTNRFATEQAADAKAAKPQHRNGAADVTATQQSNGSASVGEAQQMNAEASVAMPEPVSAPAAKPKRVAKKAANADDLKRISGIGPKLEHLLNGLGIRAVAQIAAWTDDDVQQIDAALGVDGRIARDNWVGQAKRLAA
jgi:NADH-quinone oxidoreductase subunit E